MLEAVLAKDTPQKKGKTSDFTSKNDGEKDSNFKDLFTQLVNSSKKAHTKEDPQTVINKEAKPTNTETSTQAKSESGSEKNLNALLDAIAQTSKKSEKPESQTTLQTKLLQAKNILESTLNEKIDMKDMKNIKNLKELIVKANEKGLNIKSVKLESGKNDSIETTNSNKDIKTMPNEQKNIKQSIVLSSLLDKSKSAKVEQNTKTTLSSLLSKDVKTATDTTKTISNDTKTAKIDNSQKPQLNLKELIVQNTKIDKNENMTPSNVELSKSKLTAEDNASSKNNHESLLNNKFDLKKEIELKSLQNSFAQKDLNNETVKKHLETVMQTKSTIAKESELERLIKETTPKTQKEPKEDLKSFIQNTASLNERIGNAKATIKQFASSLKDQIQNYKPPISKITLTLNPKSLGEVDVVIRTRGDSLNVQISSATAPALQVLAQNSADLRQNLMNMGFDNLSMQFSSNSQQEQRGQSFNGQEQKRYYGEDELDEENIAKINELEINLPKYV